MKIISMYLPQFHRVKENDDWWGEGYTEWVAVKKADKLYPQHMQPRIPLNKNYYDLLQKSTMEWQAGLMHQYGVDGQCFYHYWFKNGKQILEKPAENLLQWTDVNMPFCLCWANETWARTWSGIREKNGWASQFEKQEEHFGTGILLEQQYGDEKDWREHYTYLRTFFEDDRYIKYNGKPLFLIYKSRLITFLGNMLDCWNRWAIEDGFKGIYVIGANSNIDTEKYLDGILYHEPQNAISAQNRKMKQGVAKYCYKVLWDTILDKNNFVKKTYYGGFVGYDDTPRRGMKGTVIAGGTPELFQEYLSMLIAKNISAGNEYIFLNAWNEWGEGMYLEPDIQNEFTYLKAVKNARKQYVKYLKKYEKNSPNKELDLHNKFLLYRKKVFSYEKYWRVLDMWMTLREQGQKIENYLAGQKIRRIGIYGIGMLGRHLLEELNEGNIEIVCAIDQKAEFIELPIPIYKPDEMFPMVDAVIITVVVDFKEIRDRIREKVNTIIIPLEEIIMDMSESRNNQYSNT